MLHLWYKFTHKCCTPTYTVIGQWNFSYEAVYFYCTCISLILAQPFPLRNAMKTTNPREAKYMNNLRSLHHILVSIDISFSDFLLVYILSMLLYKSSKYSEMTLKITSTSVWFRWYRMNKQIQRRMYRVGVELKRRTRTVFLIYPCVFS